jgi:hypothetical protein
MDKEFVPHKQSFELKSIGFDQPCFGYHVGLGDNKETPFKFVEIKSEKKQFEWTDNVCHAPIFSQAFTWFRENHNLCGWIQESYFKGRKLYQYTISRIETLNIIGNTTENYEEAQLDCLIKLIELKTK